jgi:integrase
MSPRKKRARHVGCAFDRTPGGKLRFRFRWRFPGEETLRRFAETTAYDDTPENRKQLEAVRREIGAAIQRGTFDYLKTFPSGRHAHRSAPPPSEDDRAADETVAGYFERWLPRKLGTVAPATYRDYKQHIGTYVVPRIGATPLREIVKGTIEELRAELANIDPVSGERRGLADKSIRNILGASFRAMIRDAIDDGLIEEDPFRNLSWPRLSFEGPTPHSAGERDAILRYLREKSFRVGRGSGRYGYRAHYDYVAAVHLLFFTGMRPSEAIGLRVGDVDMRRLVVAVRGAVVLGRRKVPKTSLSERIVAIDGDTARVLEPLIKLHTTETEPLFSAPEGGLMSEEKLNRVFCDAQRALKISPIRGVYSTKDTFCSIYISRGGRWSWLSEQTGVAVQTLRRHYAKYDRTAEDDAAELARLRAKVLDESAAEPKNRANLSHDLSHEEELAEQTTEFLEGNLMEQKGFEP